MGQHGEAGTGRMKLKTADETAEIMLHMLLEDLEVKSGEELLVIVNGAGATTLMELFIVFRRVDQILKAKGIKLARGKVGEFITTQEQAGFQLMIARMDAGVASALGRALRCSVFCRAMTAMIAYDGHVTRRFCPDDRGAAASGSAEQPCLALATRLRGGDGDHGSDDAAGRGAAWSRHSAADSPRISELSCGSGLERAGRGRRSLQFAARRFLPGHGEATAAGSFVLGLPATGSRLSKPGLAAVQAANQGPARRQNHDGRSGSGGRGSARRPRARGTTSPTRFADAALAAQAGAERTQRFDCTLGPRQVCSARRRAAPRIRAPPRSRCSSRASTSGAEGIRRRNWQCLISMMFRTARTTTSGPAAGRTRFF